MVRFWPFGGDDNSPDSFERILSKLATQIQKSSSKLALLRQRSRRYKALFTMYSVLGYILYCIVVVLVVGYQNVGFQESGGLVGVPIGIYAGRKVLDLYYGRRISTTESRLETLQAEQRETIEKLKAATKYSTTQSLIEKYGGVVVATSPKPDSKKAPQTPAHSQKPRQQPQQRQPQQQEESQLNQPPPLPELSALLTPEQIRVQQQLLSQQNAGRPPYGVGMEAKTPSPRPSQQQTHALHPPQQSSSLVPMQPPMQPTSQQHLQPEEATAPKWYDRILDVILGEDEMSAKNRFALICSNCRMVNGLAPPGTRSLDDVERWGCARCGTMNGGRKPVSIKEEPASDSAAMSESEIEVEAEVKKPKRITRSSSRVVEESDGANSEVKQESSAEEAPKPKTRGKGSKRKK